MSFGQGPLDPPPAPAFEAHFFLGGGGNVEKTARPLLLFRLKTTNLLALAFGDFEPDTFFFGFQLHGFHLGGVGHALMQFMQAFSGCCHIGVLWRLSHPEVPPQGVGWGMS